jgi:hypothetical protein
MEAINVLYISAIGTVINAILLSSYLVVGKCIISYILLVNSGYTELAFMDFKFAVRNNISLSWLVKQ